MSEFIEKYSAKGEGKENYDLPTAQLKHAKFMESRLKQANEKFRIDFEREIAKEVFK